jgi:hypothetical protein
MAGAGADSDLGDATLERLAHLSVAYAVVERAAGVRQQRPDTADCAWRDVDVRIFEPIGQRPQAVSMRTHGGTVQRRGAGQARRVEFTHRRPERVGNRTTLSRQRPPRGGGPMEKRSHVLHGRSAPLNAVSRFGLPP